MSGRRCLGFRSGQLDDKFSEFTNREFVRVADVDRTRHVVGRRHHAEHRVDQIVDIAERTGLTAIAVDRDLLALQGLHDEIRDDAAVVGMHARAVRIEDSHDLDRQTVLAAIVEE
jgi:hypothetical protein